MNNDRGCGDQAALSNAPCIDEADVVVVGGGPGGLGAAVMAARQGVKTLLIERDGYLGGMASAGLQCRTGRRHGGGHGRAGRLSAVGHRWAVGTRCLAGRGRQSIVHQRELGNGER